MSPPGRPKGEFRGAQPEGSPMCPQHLRLRSIDTVLVNVPMRRALGTSPMRVTHAPLLLIDLRTEEGVTGRAYLFCYLQAAGIAAQAVMRDASQWLAGHSAAPAAVRRMLDTRFRLIGALGIVSMARSRRRIGPATAWRGTRRRSRAGGWPSRRAGYSLLSRSTSSLGNTLGESANETRLSNRSRAVPGHCSHVLLARSHGRPRFRTT